MLELRVLGPVGVWSSGAEVDTGPAKQRTVLAALALHQGPLPTGVLIDRLWGDNPPRHAHAVLYTYVSRLRAALRAGTAITIDHDEDGYQLVVDAGSVDVHRFEHLLAEAAGRPDGEAVPMLRRALGLWRGDALAALPGGWAEQTRRRLGRSRLGAAAQCFSAELRLGRHAEIVDELAAEVTRQPTAEPLVECLMLALYRAGRPAEALQAYRRASSALIELQGLEPSDRLRALRHSVLTDDPALRQDRATDPHGSAGDLAEALLSIAEAHRERGDVAGAIPFAQGGLTAAEEAGDVLLAGHAHDQLGRALATLGATAAARDHLGKALAAYEGSAEPEAGALRRLLAELG